VKIDETFSQIADRLGDCKAAVKYLIKVYEYGSRHRFIRNWCVVDSSHSQNTMGKPTMVFYMPTGGSFLWDISFKQTVYLSRAVAELRVQGEVLPARCWPTSDRSAGNTSALMATTSGRPNRPRMGFGRCEIPAPRSSMLLSVRFGTNSAMTPVALLLQYAPQLYFGTKSPRCRAPHPSKLN